VPDHPPPRRFRLLRWSLFGLALVGLGFLLQEWLSPWPRRTIAFESSFSFAGISPDGHFVATGRTPAPVGVLGGGPMHIPGFGFARRPMLERVENPIQVWDTRAGTLTATYFTESDVWNHEFSPSFRYMAAWEGDPNAEKLANHLQLVDLQNKQQKRVLLTGISSGEILFSPQENFMIVLEGNQGRTMVFSLVNIPTGKLVATFPDSTFRGFFPEESLIAYETRNDDGVNLHFWSTRTGEIQKSLRNATEPTVSPDGKILAASMSDGLIFMNMTTFQTHRFRSGTDLCPKMLFSPDSATLAVFYDKGGIELWDVSTRKRRGRDFDRLQNWTCDLRNFDFASSFSFALFSTDSTFFALACQTPNGFELTMWDVSLAKLMWSRKVDNRECRISFADDARFLVANLQADEEFEVLEAQTGKKNRAFVAQGFRLFFSGIEFTPDLRFMIRHRTITRQPSILEKLLGGWWPKGNSELIRAWVAEVVSGREVVHLESDTLEAGRLSDDAKTLLTRHKENNQYYLRVWDLPLQPPLRLVIGIPLSLGLIVFLFSRWRARRRSRTQVASSPTIPNSIMGK
jgi:WD40 repeat protein